MNSDSMEVFATDLSEVPIGPYHPLFPQGLKLRVSVDGEVISGIMIESGFQHRGLEKAIERQPWHAGIMYADRLDPEAAASAELALCLAVESISGVEVPKRAQVVRIILAELNRISSHLGFLAKMARAVGAMTLSHYVLRDRERFLDLFELLTGSRFSFCFLRFGGVSADVTEGFVERVLEACDLIRMRLKEYNDLLTYNHAFVARTHGLGVISETLAKKWSLSGPNARASGLDRDLRRDEPYSGYERYDLANPLTTKSSDFVRLGDTHGRFVLRLMEIEQSVSLLRQATESLPRGEFRNEQIGQSFVPPEGETLVEVETPRGVLGCHVVSTGAEKPHRVQFQGPSLQSLAAFREIVIGERFEDLSVILSGLDISLSEVDR